MFSWEKQKEIGDKGEVVIKNFLAARNHNIIDVSNIPSYWNKDIDIIVDGHSCEIKTDNRINKTGNLFIEYGTYFEDGHMNKGWIEITEAEFLLYFDSIGMKLYIYEMNKIKEYIQKKKNSLEIGYVKWPYYIVEGYKLPLGIISAYQIFDIKEVLT